VSALDWLGDRVYLWTLVLEVLMLRVLVLKRK
jgi:hypothetical protein